MRRHRNNRRHSRTNDYVGPNVAQAIVYVDPNEHPEKAIRKFLRKCKKEKIIERYRTYEFYEKPSVKKNRLKSKIKSLRKKQRSENNNE